MTVAYSITQSGLFEPFELQVSRGQIADHVRVFQFGANTNIQTSTTTVWTGTTSNYSYPASATVMKISSSDANDASPSGTGARTVQIIGLDANYLLTTETVALNGQTAVNTVNSYIRINEMTVLTAGTGATAAGTIYAGVGAVTSGVPATIYSLIPVGYNKDSQCVWTVPAGYTAYMTSCTWTAGNTTANLLITGALLSRPLGGVFQIESTCKFNVGTNFDRHFDTPIPFAEKTDLEMRIGSSTAGSAGTGEFHIIYIKNDATL
jgi:lipopolysaccharide export system protein LptA